MQHEGRRVRVQRPVLELSFEAACRIERDRGAEPCRDRGLVEAGRHVGDGHQCRARAVRPAVQADARGVHVGARAQIVERSVSIERPHGDFAQFRRPAFIAAPGKALRIPARPEAVDQDGDIAVVRPLAPPRLVAQRERAGVVDLGFLRVRPRPPMHHNDGRELRAGRALGQEHIADQRCFSVPAQKRHALGNALRCGRGYTPHRDPDDRRQNNKR